MSDDSSEENVFVRPLRGEGSAVRISPFGGLEPRWRPDGRELFYLHPGGRVMASPLRAGGGLDFGDPVELFRFRTRLGRENFAVAADGGSFLVLERIGDPPPLTLVPNTWSPRR